MWDRLTPVAKPTISPVTVAEAKLQCNIDFTDDDLLLDQYIKAAAAKISGTHGIGIALASQSWDLRLNSFPDVIKLPLYPVASVASIKYIDTDGAEQTWDTANYELNKFATCAVIERAWGVSWPSIRCKTNAVTVTFVAGYATAADVPEDLKQAVLMTVGHWYENREDVVIGDKGSVLPNGVEAILNRYAVGTIA